MKYSRPFNFVAYMALSEFGHPAPFLGLSFTKREMAGMIAKRSLKPGRYKPVKIRVMEER